MRNYPVSAPLIAFIRRYYGSIVPSAFTVFSMQGFLILNCIIGGQTLASVSDRLDDNLGIVIIGIISLVVSQPILYSWPRPYHVLH